MAKYQSYQKPKELPRNEVHPVWRGIGCIIILITPIISWAAAQLLLEFGKTQHWAFLYELSEVIRFPDIVYKIPGILVVANYLSSIAYLKALLMFFFLLLITFSGIFAVLNAMLYRLVGPPRYTALDEPAPRVKTKRYTR
jgi:hypothetical protein